MSETNPPTASVQRNEHCGISKNEWFALAALTAIAWIFRSIRLGSESVWIDEIWTYKAVTQHEGVLDWCRKVESTPPLYFWLAKIWIAAWAKPGVMQIRAFSVFAGGFAPAAMYLAARAWRMPRPAAWLCAFWMLVAPLAYWYSQEARTFGLLCVASTLWMATVPATFDTARPGRIVWASGAAALFAFALHYYFAFVVVGAALGLLVWWLAFDRGRETFLRLALNALWIALCMGVMLPLLWEQRHNSPASYLFPPPWGDLARVLREIYWTGPWSWSGDWSALRGGSVRVILLAWASVAAGWAWFGLKACYGDVRPEQKRLAALSIVLAAASVGALLGAFLFSRWKLPIFMVDRYTIVFLGPFMLFMAAGWSLWPRRSMAAGLPVVGFVLAWICLPTIFIYWSDAQAYDWRKCVGIVDGEWREGDRLLFCPNWDIETFQFNEGKSDAPLDAYHPETFGTAKRIWLFAWDGAPPDSGLPAVAAWRDAHKHVVKYRHSTEHSLTLVEK